MNEEKVACDRLLAGLRPLPLVMDHRIAPVFFHCLRKLTVVSMILRVLSPFPNRDRSGGFCGLN